jgi:hypothetical protein
VESRSLKSIHDFVLRGPRTVGRSGSASPRRPVAAAEQVPGSSCRAGNGSFLVVCRDASPPTLSTISGRSSREFALRPARFFRNNDRLGRLASLGAVPPSGGSHHAQDRVASLTLPYVATFGPRSAGLVAPQRTGPADFPWHWIHRRQDCHALPTPLPADGYDTCIPTARLRSSATRRTAAPRRAACQSVAMPIAGDRRGIPSGRVITYWSCRIERRVPASRSHAVNPAVDTRGALT